MSLPTYDFVFVYDLDDVLTVIIFGALILIAITWGVLSIVDRIKRWMRKRKGKNKGSK